MSLKSDTWYLTNDTWYLKNYTWYLKNDTWYLRKNTCYLKNDTRYLKNDTLREGLKKKVDRGRTLGGGGLDKYLPVHNSIVIFGKLSLGGNLIVQLCIFLCKDKTMLGYNVLVMYLRTIGFVLLALKKYVIKYHIRLSTFQ